MTRMRTLKPGFFTNDQLAELPPVARILFAGLWCLSDREGRLEDRPRRIKAEILPFDSCNVDRLLDQLQERGFILRYEIENQRFIQVLNFLRHQNPHVREPASVIPAPCEHSAGPVLGTETALPSTSSRARVPDHGIQSLEQSLESSAGPDEPDPPRDDRVDALYAHFKARIQPRSRLCPRKKIAARLKRFSLDELKAGIDHFAEDPWWMEHNADKGAEWFFESDARAEQFLLMAPRPQPTPLTDRNGRSPEPVRHIVDRTFENPLTRDE